MLMLLVGLVYYAIFCYGPMYGIQIAFKDYKFRRGIWGSEWVGLEWFRKMFSGQNFLIVFRNTLLISLYKLIAGFPAPIIFALLLNELDGKWFKKTIQTVSYLPHFLSWVILGGIFMQILSPSTGAVNYIIKMFGGTPIYFLGDIRWFRSTMVILSVWKGFGWGSIIYLATMSSINPELYEAATIDGANRWRQTINITLPALAPIIAIMFIMNSGSIINDDFDQIFNLYNETVYRVGDVISTYTYRQGLVEMKYSYTTAVGLFKNVISFGIILLTNFITSKFSDYGIW
ncbi:MAG: ABC transporter permease subunit [Clostridiaceae bacterium]|nr:ABC transporter permease subunit [Clostridiaceae bacterium]MDY3072882.1 ABC transporter permease subunit [Eubacteriales bacterium]